MNTIRRFVRPAFLVLLGLLLGLVLGITVRGRVPNAAWFGAAGTWFGATATVATILWAVHTFQVEQQIRRDAATDGIRQEQIEFQNRLEREAVTAALVRVAAYGGGGPGLPPDHPKSPGWRVGINAEVINGTGDPLIDIEVDIEGVGRLTEPLVQPHAVKRFEEPGAELAVRKGHESGKALEEVPTLRFTLNGQRWSRVGSQTPQRLS